MRLQEESPIGLSSLASGGMGCLEGVGTMSENLRMLVRRGFKASTHIGAMADGWLQKLALLGKARTSRLLVPGELHLDLPL